MLMLACLLSLRHRQADVTLLDGLRSYEQLAADLTKVGIRTRCDPRIRSRVVLMKVPPMPWDSLRPILESALDVQFLDSGNGIHQMERDPKAASFEETLLHRFTHRFDQTVSDAIQAGWGLREQLDSDPPHDGADTLENMVESIRSLPVGNPNRNALNVAISLHDNSHGRIALAELWNGIDLAHLVLKPDVSVLSSEDVAAWKPPDNPIGRTLPDPSTIFAADTQYDQPEIAPVTVSRWVFDPKIFSLARSFLSLRSPLSWRAGSTQTPVVPDDISFECTWEDLYKGLSSRSLFFDRMEATSQWMESQAANVAFTFPESDCSISKIFSHWSTTSNHPMVMEVFPVRDDFEDKARFHEGSWTIPRLLKAIVNEGLAPSCAVSPWTVLELSGVSIIQNELRFFDHLIDPNPSAATYLANARDRSKVGLNSCEDLLHASSLVSPEDNLAQAEFNLYRPLDEYPQLDPYLRLIQSDRSALNTLKHIASLESELIPYDRFPAEARRTFEKAVRMLGMRLGKPEWVVSLLPEFGEFLHNASIAIRGVPRANGIELQLEIVGISGSFKRFTLCPVSIGPLSTDQN